MSPYFCDLMKPFCFTLFLLVITSCAFSQSASSSPDSSKQILIVEASCGECQFGMKGKGCDLAIRIDGKSYFVEGADIDAYGDAHAHDGFCEAIRKAEVQGKIVGKKFKATYFKLLD